MWTPKRVMLLAAGFTLFLVGYGVYVRFLGGIDGLPALPEKYCKVGQQVGEEQQKTTAGPPEVEVKLVMAFGEACNELTYAIKMGVKSRSMVMAAKEFLIEPDGRVRLAPLSVALFGKAQEEGKYPEINTIKSNIAYLTFDRPIRTPTDMSRSKIIGGELVGNVNLANNRRTAGRDDDLTLFTRGPVYYKEDENRIWTNTAVEIQDLQSKPDPHKVNAVGMDVFLQTEPAPGKEGEPAKARAKEAKKSQFGGINGVEKIFLRSDVEMHLFVDSDSGFLGSEKKPKPMAEAKDAKEPAPAPPKSHVVIKTQGPFTFDVVKNHAQFDVSQNPGPYPNRVSVNRFHEAGKRDELDCERLQLQFVQKEKADAPKNGGAEGGSGNLEIEHAHATGKDVILTSDAEVLEAHGNDFYYETKTRLSILKGEPEMWALKEGNEIHAKELILIQQNEGHNATAIGPGRIDLLDKATGKRPLHARWKDKLVTSKDGTLDLLVFTRDAAFIDDDHNAILQADTLKVWLEPTARKDAAAPEENKPAEAANTSQPGQGHKPNHVEGIGHVASRSPDLNIDDTERLEIWFKDAPAPEAEAPAAPAEQPKEPAKPAPVADGNALPPASQPAPDKKDPSPAVAKPAEDAKPKPEGEKPAKQQRPMNLRARLVKANVLRLPTGKNELDRLWTEGNVHVEQAPSGPDDKGVDIRGETLLLTRKGESNVLVVTDGVNLAQLRMDKIYIVGPDVTIDQSTNKAWVTGAGAMEMESSTNFEGKKLNRTVPLTVHWSKTMYFDGQFAEFHGGVQAEQENARLLCQAMQVFLDRFVSLKEGDKGGPPAKVRHLIADQSVRVVDEEYEDGKLVKYQRIECPSLEVDNEEGEMTASGPGIVRILQRGAESPTEQPGNGKQPPPKGKDKKPADSQEMKLTRILYSGRMKANNKTKTAVFTQDVDTVHLPSEDYNLEPNPDKLPLHGLHVRCDRMEVSNRPENNNKNNQQMRAEGHAYTASVDASGRVTGTANVITYNESKDQVVFEGNATLYREKIKGAPRERMKGKTIIYWRKSGQFQGTDTSEIESTPPRQ